jgi:EAL domain-containing protein (putative c-di-GMP-specific phosphodiesterase class I)
MSCEYGQGYLFARPLTVRQVEAMLAEGLSPGRRRQSLAA